jgi:hypothetical protein|tara:strand:- start:17 stop:211 length:195 start_codon:yes stop_codon:yes gene_type:complete
MGKGMTPKKGYNDQNYKSNYDSIDWSSVRKNSKGLMNSKTKVFENKKKKTESKKYNTRDYKKEL